MVREAGALLADGVLRHLDDDRLAGLQDVLDLAVLARDTEGIPIDFTRVEHGVASTADVDEGGLHAGQHILDLAEVDVADERRSRFAIDVVLHEDVVLDDTHLCVVLGLAHDDLAIDRLAASQEFCLAEDRPAATAGGPGFLATLTLGLHTSGALDAGDFVILPIAAHAGSATATTTATAAGGRLTIAVVLVLVFRIVIGFFRRVVVGLLLVLGIITLGGRSTATAATATATTATTRTLGGFFLVIGILVIGILVVGIDVALRIAVVGLGIVRSGIGVGILVRFFVVLDLLGAGATTRATTTGGALGRLFLCCLFFVVLVFLVLVASGDRPGEGCELLLAVVFAHEGVDDGTLSGTGCLLGGGDAGRDLVGILFDGFGRLLFGGLDFFRFWFCLGAGAAATSRRLLGCFLFDRFGCFGSFDGFIRSCDGGLGRCGLRGLRGLGGRGRFAADDDDLFFGCGRRRLACGATARGALGLVARCMHCGGHVRGEAGLDLGCLEGHLRRCASGARSRAAATGGTFFWFDRIGHGQTPYAHVRGKARHAAAR